MAAIGGGANHTELAQVQEIRGLNWKQKWEMEYTFICIDAENIHENRSCVFLDAFGIPNISGLFQKTGKNGPQKF